MRKSMKSQSAGFTLIETLIAMAILFIGVLGLIQLQMASSLGNVTARNLTTGTNLARNKLESFRLVRAYYIPTIGATEIVVPDLVDPDSGNDLGDWANPDHQDGASIDENGNPGGIFTRAWNVVDDTPDPDIKTVRVRITWAMKDQTRNVDLEMQVARKNLDYYQ